jgi:hypothetical protein
VPEGQNVTLEVQVRDTYNNPSSGELVSARTSRSDSNVTELVESDSDGVVELEYSPPDDIDGGAETDSVNVSLDSSAVPDSSFNVSTAENVSFSLSIDNSDGNGTSSTSPAYGIGFEPTQMTSDDPGITCSGDSCMYDKFDDTDSQFRLITATSPQAVGANVDFSLNTTAFGSLSSEDTVTDSNGEADATFDATSDGNVSAYVTSGPSSDTIDIELLNVTSTGSGFSKATATSILPNVSGQNQSFIFSPQGSSIQSGTRVSIDVSDAQQASPLKVDYQGNAGANISTSNAGVNTVNGVKFVNITAGEEITTGETVRVWTSTVSTGPASNQNPSYSVDITRGDNGDSATTTFDVNANSGESELTNLKVSDLTPDTNNQEQTFVFEPTTDLPAKEVVSIDLSDAQNTGADVDYNNPGSISANVSTSSLAFRDRTSDNASIRVKTQNAISAGTPVKITISAVDTSGMSNAGYDIGFSRGDADTASSTFGKTMSGQVSYNSDGTTLASDNGGVEFSFSNGGSTDVTITDISVDTDNNNVNYVWEGNSGTGAQNREVFLDGTNDDGYLETGESESTGDAYSIGNTAALDDELTVNGGNSATVTVYEFIKQFTGSGANDRDVSGNQITVVLTFDDGSTKEIVFSA